MSSSGTTFADEVAGAATVTKDDGFLPFFDWSSPEMLDVIGGQVQLILAGRSTPETLVTEELAARRQEIEQQLAYAGMTMEAYLDSEEQTIDEFEAELEKRVRDAVA